MKVLSLFDGISCGMVALERAGIKVDEYYASEIDKDAIKISQKNYPQIKRLGNVENWKDWEIDWYSVDLVIGGSPCQGFSKAGKGLNFEDDRSKLFFYFVDILNHVKTLKKDVKFILENVNMEKEWKDIASEKIGANPILINSRFFSAQDRKRLYWTNIDFKLEFSDKNISVSDIIGVDCFAGAMRGRRIDLDGKRNDYNKALPFIQQIECRKDNKANCVTTVSKDNVVVFSKQKFFNAKENKNKWRYFYCEELEQLQTLPIDYTNCVSKSSRIKSIGNGWTVDVITHILKGININE